MHCTHVIGDATSVAQRFGSENGYVRPQCLEDVTCINTSGGNLYMQVFDITNTLVPFGTAYTAGSYTLTGLTIGHSYSYNLGVNETSLTNGAQVFNAPNAGTFIATATTAVFAGSGTNLVTAYIQDLTVPQATPVPAEGSTPKFSFPVIAGLGGTLGRECYMSGIYCCWSSTQATKTIAAASGEINILIRD